MTRKLLIASGLFLFLGASLSFASYRYAQANASRIPDFVADNLAVAGVSLRYAAVTSVGPGIGVRLSGVTIEGAKWNHKLSMENITLGVKAHWAWPPLALFAGADHLTIVPGEGRAPSRQASGSSLALLAIRALPVELTVASLDFSPYQLKDTRLSIVARHIELDSEGIKRADLHHEMKIGSSGKFPWLKGGRWGGDSVVEHSRLRAVSHGLAVGPFLLSAQGQYDGASEKWDAELGIPTTHLTDATLPHERPEWLTSMQGELALRLHAQGIGASTDAMNIEGKLRTKGLRLGVEHRNVKGEITLDLTAEVTREQSLALKATGELDLSQALIEPSAFLSKPAGMPLVARVEMAGKENRIVVSRGDVTLSNLPLSFGGEVTIGPGVNANLQIKIPQGPVATFEKLMATPLPKEAVGATLGGEVSYRGALNDPSLISGNLLLKLPHGHASLWAQLGLHPRRSLTYTVRGAGKSLADVEILAGWDPARLAFSPDAFVSGSSLLVLPSGKLVTSSHWEGGSSHLTVRTENIHAEELLGGIAHGKLSADATFDFSGLTDEEKHRTLRGRGNFTVVDGSLPALRFSRKPLEELKSIPLLGSAIRTTEVDDKFTRLSGQLRVEGGTTTLTGVALRTPLFDLTSEQLTVDATRAISGRVLWLPHGLLMRPLALELLRDHASGRTAIPLTLAGTLGAPTAKVDVMALLARINGSGPTKSHVRVGRLGRRHLKR